MSGELNSAELSRQIYSERRDKIVVLLDKVIAFYLLENELSKKEVFEALKANLQNDEFSIVVIGEFSAGKSTLLNALMGKRILPSATNETTATVNFLRHKEKADAGEAGKIFYRDGRVQTIEEASLETIEKYVSVKGENVADSIEHLDLYLESEFLKDGVTLVDSPGLNGVAEGHKEITEQQILKSHASIFLFSSDHPGSKTDFEFLYDLQKKVKTIIFVLNKIDSIKEDEGETVESVIETLKQNYKKQFPEAETVPEIWPVAAYPVLCARMQKGETEQEHISRLEAFENRLFKFLTCGEKAHQQLAAPIEHIIAVTKESKKNFEEDIRILTEKQDAQELEEQIRSIQEIQENLNQQVAKSRSDISDKIRISLKEVQEELSAGIAKFRERKLKEIDKFDDFEELIAYLQSFEKSFADRVKSLALEGEENLREKILTIAKLQYVSEAEAIEETLMVQDIGMLQLDLKNHINTDQELYEIGLKEMDEKTRKMEAELKRLREEEKEAEVRCLEARAKEKERKRLETEIQDLEKSRGTICMQSIPPVERYTEKVYEKEYRGGIFGTIDYMLFGGKPVVREVLREDSKEHDDAKARQDKELSQNADAIRAKQLKLNNFENVDASILELKKEYASKSVAEAELALAEQLRENTKKINEEYQKKIKKCKRELENACDEVSEELMRQVKTELRKSKDMYVNVVMGIVEANINKEMQETADRIRRLQEQLESSENEKGQKIQALQEKITQIDAILEESIDYQTELEQEEVDAIKQSAI